MRLTRALGSIFSWYQAIMNGKINKDGDHPLIPTLCNQALRSAALTPSTNAVA